MIRIENVFKDYKRGKSLTNVLKEINLEFPKRGFVTINGPSGCGKTTLLNLIGGLDSPTKGNIYYNDKVYTRLDLNQFRNNNIGFVFQNFNLINHLSVFDNVKLSLDLTKLSRREKKKMVFEALEKVGLTGKEKNKVTELSGGQQQRVAIARAIINKPSIILADEPTGALDTQTSDEIAQLLKELSKETLVIMVTHNIELAGKYSDRLIKMVDGKICEDTIIQEDKEIKKDAINNNSNNINNINKNINNNINNNINIEKASKKSKKTNMPLYLGFFLSLKNIITKKIRTLATIFAGCIGIISVALVTSVSSGVSKYIEKIQVEMLEGNPIVITNYSVSTTTTNNGSLKVEYPNTNEVLVNKTETIYKQKDTMTKEFIEKVNSLDKDKYTIIDYNRSIRMRLYKEVSGVLTKISLNYFYEMNTLEVMNDEYDILYGTMPDEYNEVALLVDKYNSINANTLKSVGLDSDKDTYAFDEIIGQTYCLIGNELYYKYNETKGYYVRNTINNEALESSEKIKITAIIRAKEDIVYDVYSTGIIYSKELTNYVLDEANSSDIVKEQLKYGLSKSVFTGKEFEDTDYGSTVYTASYLYEEQLLELCANAVVNRIDIYTDSFEDRTYIQQQIKESEEYKSLSRPQYKDYMSSIANDFSTFIEILTKVLIIFALIALLVSSIMTGIISYVSVLERTKEIGIMRSIGARKKDIVTIFSSENFIIGVCSAVLGITLAYLIKSPINTLVQNIIKENVSNASSVVKENLIIFDPKNLLILVVGNALLIIFSGLIPAIIASIKNPIDALK